MKAPVTFISTFITGFAELIPSSLTGQLKPKSLELIKILDGLVVYKTDAAIKDVLNIPFFNNTFLHMADLPNSLDIKEVLQYLNTSYNFHFGVTVKLPRDIRSFRLVISDENTTVNPHPNYKARVESRIAKDLKLRISPQKPDTEFWIIMRSEGFSFLGMRLTKHPDYTTSMPKGALRPELAYLIANLTPALPTGTVLDPFAGSGSLAEACAKKGWATVIASDYDRKTVQRLKGRVRAYKNIKVMQADALTLDSIQDNTIDSIITNPPWGHHFEVDPTEFYPKFLKAAYRVLREKGIMILLVENTRDVHQVLKRANGFETKEVFNTLVSGRKAQVWVSVKST